MLVDEEDVKWMTGWHRWHEDIAMHFLAFVRVFGLLVGGTKKTSSMRAVSTRAVF